MQRASISSASSPLGALERQGSDKATTKDTSDFTPEQQARAVAFDASEALQELCRDNGLTATQFVRRGTSVTTLDMFLGFWPSMQSVMYFPALRELAIIKHPTITTIDGIECCPNLEILCITECALERIANVAQCTQLRQLNLSSNRLERIENLETLTQLQVLWLNDNALPTLHGVASLAQLTQLWVCRNRIESLGAFLHHCVALTDLNVADNRISCFKSLLSLATLAHLTVLTLSDPHFGDNPVCRLCNYQTYVLCHVTHLTHLDTIELSVRTKQIADATMLKKNMYYTLRIRAIERDARLRLTHATATRHAAEQQLERSVAVLTRLKRDIERFVADLTLRDARISSDSDALGATSVDCVAAQDLKKKLVSVDACLLNKFHAIGCLHRSFERLETALEAARDAHIKRLLLELESGGNIRLEDGKPSDAWFVSCVDLVRSRFDAAALRPFGVYDMCIRRVTRISNRYLRHRFHARMDDVAVRTTDRALVYKDNVSKKGVTTRERVETLGDGVVASSSIDKSLADVAGATPETDPTATLERSLEYLFYHAPLPLERMRPYDHDQPFGIAEHGFWDPTARGGAGRAIELANSVTLLDATRLAAALTVKGRSLQQPQKQVTPDELQRIAALPFDRQRVLTSEMRDALALASTGDWTLPSGVLLVVKVFPGYTKTVDAIDATGVFPQDFPGLQSVQIPCASSPVDSTQQQHRYYYMLDSALVLPEYLVEYDYVLTKSDDDPLHQQPLSPLASDASTTPRSRSSSPVSMTTIDNASSNNVRDTETTDLGAAAKLVDDFERRYRVRRAPSASTTNNNELSLTSSTTDDDSVARVVRMEPLLPASMPTAADSAQVVALRLRTATLQRVTHLTLTSCGLESIPDLSALRATLEALVLSDNSIRSISVSAFVGFDKLRDVDLSCNQLTRLEHVGKCTALATLDVSTNHLTTFDDVAALGRTNEALTSLDLRKNDALTLSKRYRLHVLQLVPTLTQLDQQRVTCDEMTAAQQLVTTLTPAIVWRQFCRTHVASGCDASALDGDSSVDTAETATQPRWSAVEKLTLHRNLIRTIDGLERATNLRVATFADNALTRMDGLAQCTKLEELSLADNALTTLEHLELLIALRKLDVGRNRLTAIPNLETLANLTQLSLEANAITSLRGLGSALKLMELYIGHNRIDVLKEIQHLKTLPKLTILDLSGNDVTRLPDYRLYAVYYLRRVKVLDGVSIAPQDQSDAKHKYSGKLTTEFIIEKCCSGSSGSSVDRIIDMDLSACRIRELGSICGRVFVNVCTLNLENNQISDIRGLEALPKLRVLNLSRNRIERLVQPQQRPNSATAAAITTTPSPRNAVVIASLLSPRSSSNNSTSPVDLDDCGILACRHLEQLFLAYNQISDMTLLGLSRLNDLKVLHLQGNAIVLVAGLDANTSLQELHVDKNRIRQFDSNATLALRHLRVLTLEDNGIKSLAGIGNLQSLEVLELSNNRLVDMDEVDRLASLPTLYDVRLVNNPITKKHLYRQSVVNRLCSSLKSLDGRDVLVDERERVATLFVHERAAAAAAAATAISPTAYSGHSASDRFIEARSYGSTAAPSITFVPATIPTKTTANVRTSSIPQFATNDVLAGSLLRKHSVAHATAQSQNQYVHQQQQQQHHLSFQAMSAFAKADHAADASGSSSSATTNKRGLLSHAQVASYRNANSLTNQATAMFHGGSHASGPPSPAVTVASAFSAALAPGGGGSMTPTDFHLGGLRSDRRRQSSVVHYEQQSSHSSSAAASPHSGSHSSHSASASSTTSNGSDLKLPVGIVSSLAVIRGPTSLAPAAAGSGAAAGNGQSRRKPLVLSKPLIDGRVNSPTTSSGRPPGTQ